MKNIDFKGKRVLVRVDYNVPLNAKHEITDDTRIQRSLPTLRHILDNGGKLVLMSHLGRPQKKKLSNGEIDIEKFSLRHIVGHLSTLLGETVIFSTETIGEDAFNKSNDKHVKVLLLENTRFTVDEKNGDIDFAKSLASLGDIYINDAFGTAHRAHASTAIVANYFESDHKALGFLIQSELENAKQLLEQPQRPFTAIVGGAKVSDKMLLLDKLLDKVDNLVVGGGMAYTFLKANGGQIGNSLVELDYLDLAIKIQSKAKANGVTLILPVDSNVSASFSNDADRCIEDSMKISDGYMGLDVGPKAIKEISEVILNSKSILWNGPLGVFEFDNFSQGTFAVANSVAETTNKGAFSLIGGGDSVSAINKSGLADQVSFISTGGGAMLELLEGKELPGIKAIK